MVAGNFSSVVPMLSYAAKLYNLRQSDSISFMSHSTLSSPVIVKNGKASPVPRIAFGENFQNEDWLQQLLFDHPELIPFEEIDPLFRNSVAVAREVESGSGPVDIVYVNPDGLLTLVETKLWRNPEARREVVAQLINYASQFASMSYDELTHAIAEAEDSGPDHLVKRARTSAASFDEQRFHDAISKNLRHGRFLLLIVGDGIREDVGSMAEFLHRQPQLGFTLRLVEMAIYRLNGEGKDSILVVPHIVARTQEVLRAIVEVRGDRVVVETPPEPKRTATGRSTMTDELFFTELSKEVTPDAVTFARWMIEHASEHRLEVQWMMAGPVFKYVDSDHDVFFTLGQFDRYGNICELGRFPARCEKLDLPEDIWKDYLDETASLIPTASRKHFVAKSGNSEYDDVIWDDDVKPLESLAGKQAEWLAAIDKAISSIRKAMK